MLTRLVLLRLKRLLLLYLTGSSLVAAAEWMPQPTKSSRIPKVKSLYDARSYAKALEELRGAIGAGGSEQDRLWLVLAEGEILAEQGNSARALEMFRRRLDLSPAATLPLGSDKAMEIFARAQKDTKDDLLGKISENYKALRYEDALKTLAKAARLPLEDKDRLWVLLMTGVVQAELNKPGDALDSFVAALDLDPETVLPVESSAKVLALFKRAPEGLPSYREKRKKTLTDTLNKAITRGLRHRTSQRPFEPVTSSKNHLTARGRPGDGFAGWGDAISLRETARSAGWATSGASALG